MNKILGLIICSLIISCGSTRIARLDAERCATEGRGLVPIGVNSGESTTHFYNHATKTNAVGSTESRVVMCGKSKDKYETCLSQQLVKSGIIINEYNEGAETREVLTGLGYSFIAPGILGAVYNTSVNKKHMKKISKIRKESFSYCEKYRPADFTL